MTRRATTATDPRTGLTHNPAFTRMMAARGFFLKKSSGGGSVYEKQDVTVGQVVVTDAQGHIPLRARESTYVIFFGLEHDEPLLEQRFPSLPDFAATVAVTRRS